MIDQSLLIGMEMLLLDSSEAFDWFFFLNGSLAAINRAVRWTPRSMPARGLVPSGS